jgi:hypothetical protein
MTKSTSPSRPTPALPPVRTPCIGVCSTGIGDSVCRGCKRFAHEVIDWNSYSQEEKRIVDRRLSLFLSQCVSHKIDVIDEPLLRWQLGVQQIRFNEQHDAYCWLFTLLKAGARQITDTHQFGFSVRPPWRHVSLVALRDQIDHEFWVLSSAHFERYQATPDLFSQ